MAGVPSAGRRRSIGSREGEENNRLQLRALHGQFDRDSPPPLPGRDDGFPLPRVALRPPAGVRRYTRGYTPAPPSGRCEQTQRRSTHTRMVSTIPSRSAGCIYSNMPAHPLGGRDGPTRNDISIGRPFSFSASLAPAGPRAVATGGAQDADRRPERNPWKSRRTALPRRGKGSAGRGA